MPQLRSKAGFPRRWLLFAAASAILVVLSAAMVVGVRTLAAALDETEHSHEVIRTATSLLATIRAFESNSRGFRVTERTEFYAAYVQARTETRELMERLLVLTRRDADQYARTGELQRKVEERIRVADGFNAIQLREGGAAARRAVLGTTAGYETMEAVENAAITLIKAETALLAADRARIERLVLPMSAGVVLGVVVPLALMGLMLWLMLRENRRTAALEHEARLAADELRALLTQRDRLSEQRHKLGLYAGMLQSCQTIEEAMQVTAELIGELLPAVGGRCYHMHPSGTQVDAIAEFGPQAAPSAPVLHPSDCWGLRRGQPHASGSLGQVRCTHIAAEAPADAWTLCLPLLAQGTSLGLLYLSGAPGQPLGEDRQIVEAVAEQLSLAMINLRLREELRTQSLRDPLTGLCNRRYLNENLQRELLRCERRHQPLSVVMLDIDHFKRFNDTYGHIPGDELLAEVGHVLARHVRAEDLACRYGGEEFVLVLPETTRDAALQRAEEVRAAIGEVTVQHLGQTLGPVSASLGVASSPESGRTAAELLQSADAALYRAKAAGRNRTVAAA